MNALKKPVFTPLYGQVKKAILERIVKGEWGPGSFLPSEMALAEEYGVSQGTLRKALNALTREKRLVRYQGKGTAVAVLDEDSALFPFFLFNDRKGTRVFPVSKVRGLSTAEPGAEEAQALGLGPGESVIHIDRVRFLNEQPFINERVTLPAACFAGFGLDMEKVPNTLYEYYQLRYGITISRATEQIEATVASQDDEQCLHVAPAHPLLLVSRITYDLQDRPIEFRRSRVNTSHNFVYRAELR